MQKDKKVLIITSDNLYHLYQKGELIPRYYNPRNLFSHVIFADLFSSPVKKRHIAKACGNAGVNIIKTHFPKWRQWLALLFPSTLPRKLVKYYTHLIKSNKIDLIRCYGHRANLLLGCSLKKKTGLPLIASIHINPDLDILDKTKNVIKKILLYIIRKTEVNSMRQCDHIIAVYKSIIPYLNNHKIKNYSVIYNAVQVPSKNT